MTNTLTEKSNKTIRINGKEHYLKSIFVIFLLSILIFFEAVYNGSYFDEVLGIISAVYLLFVQKKVKRNDIITIILLTFTVAIGILSNLIYELTPNIFSICVDITAVTKLTLTFFAVKYFLNDEEKMDVIEILVPFSKLYTISAFFCSILSQFVDIGMTNDVRYGIKAFGFIFLFNHQYVAVYMLVFGVLVCTNQVSQKRKNIYYFMAIISMVMSTKAPPILFSIVFLFLSPYFKKHKKLSIGIVAPIAILVLIASSYQLDTYLLSDSARSTLWKYSFITANEYFPLGSGFSTYGSDQASREYSILYQQYGFENQWGLGRAGTASHGFFLNDNFWPMSIGQFGYFGTIAYIAVFVRIFLSLSNGDLSNSRKAFLYAAFFQYMIHAIGSAILSSSAGMIGFALLSLFTVESKDDTTARRLKIRIK